MKPSILALLISSTLILSACEDKQTQAKLAEAEQNVVQLKQELEKSQTSLKSLEQQVNEAKEKVAYLTVRPETIISEEHSFTRTPEKTSEDDYRVPEANINHQITIMETNYPWLNDLIYQTLIADFDLNALTESNPELKKVLITSNPKQSFQSISKHLYEVDLEATKTFESHGYHNLVTMSYLGQKQNLVSFSTHYETYSGGAHGMNWTNFIHIDTDNKSIVKLDNLLSANAKPMLEELLWNAYKEDYQITYNEGKPVSEDELYTQRSDFYISEQFYIDQNSINFVYPPYAIGPFAFGEITLKIYNHDLAKLINPKYQWLLNL